jgi:hypothetical protein
MEVNNLLVKKEVVLSTKEVLKLVYFAIENSIVDVSVIRTNDVPADEDDVIIEGDTLTIVYKDICENVFIKPNEAIESCS